MTTIVIIPGRPAQTIQGMLMTIAEVISAFAATMDLSQFQSDTTTEEGVVTHTFSNRTGTKGATGTVINIPGRPAQTIEGMVMGVDDVKAAFAGTVDLSSYQAAVSESGDMQVVTFSNRTGTKGK